MLVHARVVNGIGRIELSYIYVYVGPDEGIGCLVTLDPVLQM